MSPNTISPASAEYTIGKTFASVLPPAPCLHHSLRRVTKAFYYSTAASEKISFRNIPYPGLYSSHNTHYPFEPLFLKAAAFLSKGQFVQPERPTSLVAASKPADESKWVSRA